MVHVNKISKTFYEAGLKIHQTAGPGSLPGGHVKCLRYTPGKAGICSRRQMTLPRVYEGIRIDLAYRPNLRVADKLNETIKAMEAWTVVQVFTYLKQSVCKPGLWINLDVNLFKTGVRRMINGSLWSIFLLPAIVVKS
jgi:GxxExxY protein